jgi:predicted transcriptional regulator
MSPGKPKLPLLTRAETEIMRVLWEKGSATVHDVVEGVSRPLAYTTVLTMLRVLEQKGYATHDPKEGGRAHVYRPTASEAGVRKSHMRDFIDRLFGGRAEELMIGLLRDERLSRADLELLRSEIDVRLADEKHAQQSERPTNRNGDKEKRRK